MKYEFFQSEIKTEMVFLTEYIISELLVSCDKGLSNYKQP